MQRLCFSGKISTSYQPWLNMDKPWSRLYVDYAGFFFQNVQKYLKYRRSTSIVTVIFLHEQFPRFGVTYINVSVHAGDLLPVTSTIFCKYYAVEHLTTPPYRLRSNEGYRNQTEKRRNK